VHECDRIKAILFSSEGGSVAQISQALRKHNWSEVLQKLERAGINTAQIESALKALGLKVLDFTADKIWAEMKLDIEIVLILR